MIKVTVIANGRPAQDIVEETKTLREVLTEMDVNYDTTTLSLDGCILGIGDLDKSFAEHGVTRECRISAITKVNNA